MVAPLSIPCPLLTTFPLGTLDSAWLTIQLWILYISNGTGYTRSTGVKMIGGTAGQNGGPKRMAQNEKDDNREHPEKHPEHPKHDHKEPHHPGRNVPPPRPHGAPIPQRSS